MESKKTTSIPAAAYVVARGANPPQLEPLENNYYQFVFDDYRAADLVAEYFAGGTCAAHAFFTELQKLRTAINRLKLGGAR